MNNQELVDQIRNKVTEIVSSSKYDFGHNPKEEFGQFKQTLQDSVSQIINNQIKVNVTSGSENSQSINCTISGPKSLISKFNH